LVPSLRDSLAALAPTVRQEEAQRAAACAFEVAQRLEQEYAPIGPPLFHNLLINLGLKKRGLCCHWTEDMLAPLQALRLQTLDLHWGVARAGTLREHSSVVVTAKGQAFEEGIVLDAWRHSGRLYWAFVAVDRYPWKKGVTNRPP